MDNVRTISRGVDLLAFLSRAGSATGSHIASQLGLSRPSTYRLLETLETCGLIRHSEADNKYSLAWPVRTLSSGLTDCSRVLCLATPVLYDLQQMLLWPTDLATHENGEMVIHESTHPVSPYSIETGIVGSRHPMLMGSLGRAYLAFCPDEERAEILRHFLPRCAGGQDFLNSRTQVEWILGRTRKDGFGSRNREFNSKTSSIAMPIRFGGRVMACMSVSWISSAMPFSKAVTQFVPPLQAACQTVEQRLLETSLLDASPDLSKAANAA
jgi:IclR family mhp operon transcriptional activator